MAKKRASEPLPLIARPLIARPLIARFLRALAVLALVGGALAAAVLVSGLLEREARDLRGQSGAPLALIVAAALLSFLPALVLWLLARRSERPRAHAAHSPTPARSAKSSARRGGSIAEAPALPPAALRSSGPPPRWVAPGEECSVCGRTLRGGMLYLGSGLASVADPRTLEPALIDPTLALDERAPDREGRGLDYWPSYSAIPPACRAAYLDWLAGGRRDPRAPIGYVFLFFYGLERRLLLDAEQGQVSSAEIGALAGELRRLLELYGEDRSFRTYADSLLDHVCVRFLAASDEALPPPLAVNARGLPARLRIALGRRVERGEPIPATLALEWLRHDEERSLPLAARRAPAEFESLFRRRLAPDFGRGLSKLRARATLFVSHRPASSSFGGQSFDASLPLPDVTRWRKPVEELERIARDCGEELAGYARWLGRNPGAAPDLPALAHLPRELLDARDDPPLERLRALARGALRDAAVALVDGRALLRDWPLEGGARPTKRDCAELARLLGRLGYGIEPDVRFGGARLALDERCALFPLDADAPHAPSSAWAAATSVLHLSAFLGRVDGEVGPQERVHIEALIESGLELPSAERPRLRAHLHLLLAGPLELTGLERRLRALSAKQRAATGGFLVQLACADGRVDPAEVRALERIYALLQLDPAGVHRDLHGRELAGAGDAPVRVRAARPDLGERAIPPPRVPAGIELDGALIRRKLAETARVSALLQDIFDADEPEEAQEERAPATGAAAPLVAGLDAAHSALFHALVARGSWARDEVEELARHHDLMPDGALDTLNDAAFERCDAPLWEGDDPIEIDPSTAMELTR